MEDKEAPNSAFTMSIKGMAMLTVCSVFSLRNLPSIAEYGWNIIFFLSAQAQRAILIKKSNRTLINF